MGPSLTPNLLSGDPTAVASEGGEAWGRAHPPDPLSGDPTAVASEGGEAWGRTSPPRPPSPATLRRSPARGAKHGGGTSPANYPSGGHTAVAKEGAKGRRPFPPLLTTVVSSSGEGGRGGEVDSNHREMTFARPILVSSEGIYGMPAGVAALRAGATRLDVLEAAIRPVEIAPNAAAWAWAAGRTC